ncbi:MAG: DNA-directed RNA polymerase subunit beta', partial [Patescibacteria group bacterium]
TAFNADFDGDQMAVHVPLTAEARQEAAELMLSSKNLLKPATGEPVATPGKDIILGCYYLTQMDESSELYVTVFSSAAEARLALDKGLIKLSQKIKVSHKGVLIETSVGRLIFNEIIPDKIDYVNETTNKKVLNRIVGECFYVLGVDRTAQLLDDMMLLAFDYATRSGMSWGMDDLPLLPEKKEMIANAQKQVDAIEVQYQEGLLTDNERLIRVIELWAGVKEKVTELSKKTLGKNIFSPVYSMIESGARGSWGQTTQMMGMKGLVTSPSGATIELPIKASFKEGFDVLEYFISTHGARKGLTDTALRTANAGYLTRRLIDVSQDIIISEENCGDHKGWLLTQEDSDLVGEKLVDRLWGRALVEDLKDAKDKVLVKKGEIITREQAEIIKKADVTAARIRSAITCKSTRGICKLCYGYDLGHNRPVELGTAVGIIAAQSIGEPGTQLTMRTFHTGGVASAEDITQGLPRVEEIFEARRIHKGAVISEVRGKVMSIRKERDQKTIVLKVDEDKEEKYNLEDYEEKSIKVEDGERVKKGDVLISEGDDVVNASIDGVVKITKKFLKVVSAAGDVVEYALPSSFGVSVKEGDLVSVGDVLTEGSVDLHDLYLLKGQEATQRYIIREIQNIYSSQGQKLNDKHLEIITRQMFSRVYVKEVGATEFLPGEIIDHGRFDAVNAEMRKLKKNEAIGDVMLMGVTKASLSTESFLSAASFQETARVLIDAAISGKVDNLVGLKENVIIGRLIPAGTGFNVKR